MTRVPLRRFAISAFVAVVATLMPAAATPSGAAGWTAPGFVRSIAGRGEAGVYAWGMAFNPVSNEILVGDYWNFQIRRYDLTGHEVGAFFRAPVLRKGQPYSISVDPRNGDIYVSEISDGKPGGWIARYDRKGTYLSEFQSDARYTAWHAADENGYLFIADSHYWNNAGDPPKIRKYNLSAGGTQVMSFGSFGTGSGQLGIVHGLATDAAGRIYAADAMNRRVSVFTSSGQYLYAFGSAGNGVGQFTGDLRGMALDRQNGRIYVVDAEAAQVEVFQMSANPASDPPQPVAHWGSEGSGLGQYADGGRAITIDANHDVWVADYGNFRFLRYSPDGTLLATYPSPAEPPAPGGFAQVRDVAVAPDGTVWGADTWNNRFQRFGADGAFQASFGQRNSHPPYGMDYPRGIAVDPASGNVWVASTRDHLIRVYSASGAYLRTVGSGADSSATGSFRWPMDIEFAGAVAWVADYTSCRLKKIDVATGTELQSITQCNNGIAIDPTTGNLLVVSWRYDKVYRYSSSGSLLGSWGSSGTGPGQFQNPWDIDVVNVTPGGSPTYRVLVADAQLARVEVFDLNGSLQGEFGGKGNGVFQLSSPSGLAHDAQGRIYVADAGNDRIQVFSFSIPLPSGDTTPPAVAIATPANNSVVPAQVVTIGGSASDAVALGKAEVSIKDRVTGRWWDAKDALWGTHKVWNIAPVAGASTTSMTFSFGFVGVSSGGAYLAQAKATDTAGNTKTSANVQFTLEGGLPPDTSPPITTVSQPTKGQVLPVGPVSISGTAVDDTGVTSTQVAIKDRGNGMWWHTNGTWGAFAWVSAGPTNPGATSTPWGLTWTGAVHGGSYYAQVRSADAWGNVEGSPHSVRFTIA